MNYNIFTKIMQYLIVKKISRICYFYINKLQNIVFQSVSVIGMVAIAFRDISPLFPEINS